MKWTLGVGGSNHDFSATLLRNDHPVALIEAERLTKIRHGDRSWNSRSCYPAVEYCLQNAGKALEDIDHVYLSNDIEGQERFWESLPHTKIGHHICHGAAAFYTSPFEEAAVLVIDGKGAVVDHAGDDKRIYETISFGEGKGNKLDIYTAKQGEHYVSTSAWTYVSSNSIGWFYSIVSDSIGMGSNGEGKAMALAAYGEARFVEALKAFVSYDEDNLFVMDPYCGIWDFLIETLQKAPNSFSVRADLAASAQVIIEEAVLLCAKRLQKETGQRRLVYGGGVALNGVANHRIRNETGFEDIFIFPASGDNGLSTGAALYGYHHIEGNSVPERSLQRSVLFSACGKNYSSQDIHDAAYEMPVSMEKAETAEDFLERLVSKLKAGEVIAIFQNSSEFGPRALGNRSLIALPSVNDIQATMNLLKRRETFRPFAPIVMEEDVDTYFDMTAPSPFMLEIAAIKAEYREALAGASHIDGSARIQTIASYQKGIVRPLLQELKKQGLPPVIINTSFNLKGVPIVETPKDAVQAFLQLDIKNMLIGNYWLSKQTELSLP